ncbi:pilus assembly PilX family protein [Rubrivivax albus]|nr:PilX N-terminal domain-containing pilus assembly protein [Rubrivivax albus]
MRPTRTPYVGRRQRGVTTLIIVSVLFFILALVAAYTNRNMIFEQRTAGNQFRSTLAFEAVEAGVEWTLSMLNNGRIDDDCLSSDDAAQLSFRQRYLNMSADTGLVDPGPAFGADLGGTVWPSCVFNGADWTCSCPVNGDPALVEPVGAGVFPAFRVRFVRHVPQRPGLVWLEVNGCTRLDDTCLDFPAAPVAGEGRMRARVLVALKSALPAVPSAAITVLGDVDVPGGGTTLWAINGSAGSGGLAVMAGGSVDTDVSLGSSPGSPADRARVVSEADPSLVAAVFPPDAADARNRMFSNVFATTFDLYRDQAATLVLDCDPCGAADVREAAERHPGRILWLAGDASLDSGGGIGSPAAPVMLVVNGALALDVPLHGVVYSRGESLALSGAGGSIQGALIGEGDLDFESGSTLTVTHEAQTLNRLRWTHGTFVRVPGGWRDF